MDQQPHQRPDRLRQLAIVLGAIGVAGCLIIMRVRLAPYGAYDTQHFVVGWFNHLEAKGWRGLRTRFADYNVPYLYLLYASTLVFENGLTAIKVISNLGDLVLAWGIWRLVEPFRGRRVALGAAFVTLVLPGVWLNSAVWGQTDQLYTAIVVHALADLLRGHQRRGWVLFGLALAFKLQAVFVLPVLLVLWLRDRRRDWTAPPLAVLIWAATAIPVLLIGLSVGEWLRTYAEQTATASRATVTMNLWRLLPVDDPDLISAFTPFAAALTGAVMVWALLRDSWWHDRTKWLALAATIALLLPYTLPEMRNRYFFLAEVLLLAAAFVRPRLWPAALLCSITSTLSYANALFNKPFPLGGDVGSSVPFLIVLVLLARETFRDEPDEVAISTV